jgi:hypothetical protein
MRTRCSSGAGSPTPRLGFGSKPPLGVFGRRLAEVAIEDQIEIVVVDEDPLEDVLVD